MVRDPIWLLWKFFEIIGRIRRCSLDRGKLARGAVRQRSSVVCNQGFYRIMDGATRHEMTTTTTSTDVRFVAVASQRIAEKKEQQKQKQVMLSGMMESDLLYRV